VMSDACRPRLMGQMTIGYKDEKDILKTLHRKLGGLNSRSERSGEESRALAGN
jgi:hypothetical protein